VDVTIAQEGLTGQYIEADGLRLYYREIGSGPPVVMLHGAGPGADGWGNFRTNVDRLSARHRLILPDLPRFGRSDKPHTERPRLDFLSSVMSAFLRSLGVERAHLIGNSLGGQAAMKLAIDHPEQVDRIVVIGSNAVSRSVLAPMPTEAVRQISEYYQGSGPSPERMRRLLESLVYDRTLVTTELVQERYEASIDPEIVAVNQAGHWPRQSLDAELPSLGAPTLIVWGQDDRASPIEAALAMLRLIPDSRLHVFPRCGHWAQVEHAVEFDRIVLDFLAAGRP
jgi:pimeloyl-ACP methyl ester carboxylesterase